MSPYRNPHVEITLPVGVKRYEATYENIVAVFSYGALDGTSSAFTKEFNCIWNHSAKGTDNVYVLSEDWNYFKPDQRQYVDWPCRNGYAEFEHYVSTSKNTKILKHENIWIPWERLDKILIVTREPVNVNFLWRQGI